MWIKLLKNYWYASIYSNQAFTMIEVLVALSVIAIVSIVAIPNVRKFSATQDITNATSNIVNALRRGQSNAVSGIRCSYDLGTNPVPAHSYNIRFTSTGLTLTTLCINKISSPAPLNELDYTASPTPDPNTSFIGTSLYIDSGHVKPKSSTIPGDRGHTVIGTTTYTNTCQDGLAYISFKESQVYYYCSSGGSNPIVDPSLYLLVPQTNYYVVMTDDRGVAGDVVISISPSGVIGVIQP